MRKNLILYSNLWATVLMLVFFFISGITGGNNPYLGGSGVPANRHTASGFRHLQGKVIVLDPGHGGGDPGTVGVGRTTEAENVLAIAWELKGMLERAGAEVIMTRQTDQNPAQGTAFAGQQNGQLAARVATANRSSGQIFISLHNDWNDNSYIQGTSVHYYKGQDLALAEALQSSLVRQVNSVDLGIKRSNFYVLRHTNVPSALVEVGFLSNSREAALLAQPTYRVAVARGLLAGINEYFRAAF